MNFFRRRKLRNLRARLALFDTMLEDLSRQDWYGNSHAECLRARAKVLGKIARLEFLIGGVPEARVVS